MKCNCGSDYEEVIEKYELNPTATLALIIPQAKLWRCPACKDEMLPPETQVMIDEMVALHTSMPPGGQWKPMKVLKARGLPDPELPQNLEEWLAYVIRYEHCIFVREEVKGGKKDGQWENKALDELSSERWAFHVARWLEEGVVPTRVKE